MESESGQSLVEYALILATIALLSVATATFLSGRIGELFASVSNSHAFTPPSAATVPPPADGNASEQNRSTLMLALPAIDSYRAIHDGWVGMNYPRLRALDDRVEPIVVVYANDTGYCVTNTGERELWYQSPSGLTQTPCGAP